jgi:hypothetical protein
VRIVQFLRFVNGFFAKDCTLTPNLNQAFLHLLDLLTDTKKDKTKEIYACLLQSLHFLFSLLLGIQNVRNKELQ